MTARTHSSSYSALPADLPVGWAVRKAFARCQVIDSASAVLSLMWCMLRRSALERTFLAWMHMAVTLGGVMTALVGFTYTDEDDPESPYRHASLRQRRPCLSI